MILDQKNPKRFSELLADDQFYDDIAFVRRMRKLEILTTLGTQRLRDVPDGRNLIVDLTNLTPTGQPANNNVLPPQAGNAGKFLSTDGVSPSWSRQSAIGASVVKQTFQTVSNATNTKVIFDLLVFDTNSIWNTAASRFVVPYAGVWRVTACLAWNPNATGFRQLLIYKNGTEIVGLINEAALTVGGNHLAFTYAYKLAIGDSLEVQAYQNSGGNLDVYATGLTTETCMQVELIGTTSGVPDPVTDTTRMKWLGTWNSLTTYAVNDTVIKGAITYVATAANTNLDPATNPASWDAANNGFANPMTTAGDLIVGGASGAAGRLAKGADGLVLTMVSGSVAWAAASGGFANPMTTVGDLIVGSTAGAATRLGIGSAGTFLSVTGGAVVWGNGPMTTAGDLILGGTSGAPTRLAKGSDGQYLQMVSGSVTWSTASVGVAGSDTQIQYNSSGAFGASANLTYASSVITSVNALAANTAGDGLVLDNTTAATASNQRFSPRLRLSGRGWKTTATAASQQCDWIIENRPVQGTTNPTSLFHVASQINAAGYVSQFLLGSNGVLEVGAPDATAPSGGASAILISAASNSVAPFIGCFQKVSSARDYGGYMYAAATTSDLIFTSRRNGSDTDTFKIVNNGAQVSFLLTGDSTATSNGSVILAGGLGVAKTITALNVLMPANAASNIRFNTGVMFDAAAGGNVRYSCNLINTGAGDKYLTTAGASVMQQIADNIYLRIAASGSAGSTITWSEAITMVSGNRTLIGNPTDDTTTRLQVNGAIKTSTPAGGTADAWKFGQKRTSTGLAVSTTGGIQLDVGGTLYTLAILTTNP